MAIQLQPPRVLIIEQMCCVNLRLLSPAAIYVQPVAHKNFTHTEKVHSPFYDHYPPPQRTMMSSAITTQAVGGAN